MAKMLISYYIEGKAEEEIDAVRVLAQIHEEFEAPATFAIVGRTLEEKPDEFRSLLDKSLFEIQSHSYSHRILKSVPHIQKRTIGEADVIYEINKGCDIIEENFQRKVTGFACPVIYQGGLKGQRDVLSVLKKRGILYVTSDGRGENYTHMRFPPIQPYWYKEEGFPEILEIPVNGWRDCVLLGYSGPDLVFWPPIYPWGYPPKVPKNA